LSANERRMAIWHTLCSRRRCTTAYLAAEYGVSIRTIRYDIDHLSLSYPIEVERGRYGCIKISDGCSPVRPLFTEKQMALLWKIHAQLDGDDARMMESIITVAAEARAR